MVTSQLLLRFYSLDSTSITTGHVQQTLILRQSQRRNPAAFAGAGSVKPVHSPRSLKPA
jgi:hypothetical protein